MMWGEGFEPSYGLTDRMAYLGILSPARFPGFAIPTEIKTINLFKKVLAKKCIKKE